MGVDLVLMFAFGEDGESRLPATCDGVLLGDRLTMPRHQDAYRAIRDCGLGRQVDAVVVWRDGQRVVGDRDGQGNLLRWMTAAEIARVLSPLHLDVWTEAIRVFLERLPPATRVYLWWR